MGIICACLPTLRPVTQYPLLNRLKIWRSSRKSDPNTPRIHKFGPISGPSEARKQFNPTEFSLLEDDNVSRPQISSKPVQLRSKQLRDSHIIVVENRVEVVRETV